MSSGRLALLSLGLASPALVAACLAPRPLADVLFTLLVPVFPLALIALGARRGGRLGPLTAPLVALFLLLEGSLVGMLLLRGEVAAGPWIAGLPLAAALQLFGLFLLPLLLVALAHGLTFEHQGLRQDDLDTLRRRFPPPSPPPER